MKKAFPFHVMFVMKLQFIQRDQCLRFPFSYASVLPVLKSFYTIRKENKVCVRVKKTEMKLMKNIKQINNDLLFNTFNHYYYYYPYSTPNLSLCPSNIASL